MPKSSASDLAVRKKMRKGTHSCFECRRRKIRCIYPADNPEICSECFARGSRCIDQEHASPDIVVDHRKNLRERVSRLEALVDSLLDERSSEKSTVESTRSNSTKIPDALPRSAFPPTPLSSEASSSIHLTGGIAPLDRGNHVPILSVFEDVLNDAEVRTNAGSQYDDNAAISPGATTDRYTVVCKNNDDIDDTTSAAHQAKRDRTKAALLAVLPPYDRLNRILNTNDEWWETWRKKCSGTSNNQTLAQFASKALTGNSIGAIGIVVLSVGICSDDEDVDRYIEAVDRYVLSDDEYAATVEGMECLILKGKWYADVGQPRRAWLASRKGLMFAQLMGLHRKRTNSAPHESVWWSLYHGDRFMSLLLGLPYGISDSHCDLSFPDIPGDYLAPLVFINKVSVLAGKVIDRNQGMAEQSFAWALQLDQELEDLYKKLDPNWLETAGLMMDIEANAAELRERVMAQMVYHQIRVYLHLPFMLKSESNSRFAYSRTACLHGSREILRLYHCLRTGGVQPLYECKAVDFIGFTAAVLITLGLFNYGMTYGHGSTPQAQEGDIRLIEISIDIFRHASSEKGGKVALQSADVLEKMLTKLKNPPKSAADCDGFADFVIPYFGTISIWRGGKPKLHGQLPKLCEPTPPASTTTQLTPASEKENSFGQSLGSGSVAQEPFNFNPETVVSYEGFYNLSGNASEGLDTQINEDGMGNFPLPTNNFSWQNVPMDIDQDWSWFLNDNQASMGGVASPPQPVDNQFTHHNYMGF